MNRRPYLDVLRGIAVVIMVEAHVVDSWTRDPDRHGPAYFGAIYVAGLAAPLFLLLAGLTLAMAASARAEKVGRRAAAGAAMRRGWQVFGLAFLFRLQAHLLGQGPLINLLKVDILNVMGVAMVIAAALWGLAGRRSARLLLLAAATTAATMMTPVVREAAWLNPLPDPIEWYFRPAPNRTTFTLFPWTGFLFAGALIGELIHAIRDRAGEWRLQAALFAASVSGIAFAYLASFLPSIYAVSNFWTSSPTYFFIRLGLVSALVPIAPTLPRIPALETLGRSSLFVYWIHVEMVYGVIAAPIKRSLPLAGSLAATLALCALLYGLVILKNRMFASRTPQASRPAPA